MSTTEPGTPPPVAAAPAVWCPECSTVVPELLTSCGKPLCPSCGPSEEDNLRYLVSQIRRGEAGQHRPRVLNLS